MFYSAERYEDGSSCIFMHASFGVIPLIMFGDQTTLGRFIIMLQSCQDKIEIPDAFKKAFEG